MCLHLSHWHLIVGIPLYLDRNTAEMRETATKGLFDYYSTVDEVRGRRFDLGMGGTEATKPLGDFFEGG